jgi:hypothetical protein
MERLAVALKARDPLSKEDWERALLATEIAFASSVRGSGTDWAMCTGLSDEITLTLLREAQRRLGF